MNKFNDTAKNYTKYKSGFETLKSKYIKAIASGLLISGIFSPISATANTSINIEKHVVNIMSNTTTEREVYSKAKTLGIKFALTENLISKEGNLASYDAESKKVFFDKESFENAIKGFDVHGIYGSTVHELQHAIDLSKFNLPNLNPKSYLLLSMLSEVNARISSGLTAFEEGGDAWETFKTKIPETSIRIENKHMSALGSPINNMRLKSELRKEFATSFFVDKITTEDMGFIFISAANLYKLKYSAAMAIHDTRYGKENISENEIIKRLDLNDVKSEISKYNLLLTKEEVAYLLEAGIKPSEAEKIPTMETSKSKTSAILKAFGTSTR